MSYPNNGQSSSPELPVFSPWNLGKFSVSPNSPCIIIGEVAQAHDGSLGMAHAYIDAIAKTGAHAVKFQTHIASAESTPSEPWRVKFSFQDDSRYEYWKRMEFTKDQWLGLKQHATEKGLLFLSTPFSVEAAQMLESLEIEGWKVGSGETTNFNLLDFFISTKKPIILSTGMSSLDEIDTVEKYIRERDGKLAIMQCTTAYPCPPEKVGLNMIELYRSRYPCAIGLSDHSGTIFPGLAAATLGIQLFEAHITFSKEMFGPDVPASITVPELEQLVKGITFIEKMRNNPVKKNEIAQEMAPVRALFTKSIVAKTDLRIGTILAKEHIIFKKPGTGIPASELNVIIGRRVRKDISSDSLLQYDDFE